VTHRGPGLWDEVCSPKMQWRSLLALADLFVINRPHTLLLSKIGNATTFMSVSELKAL